jgi:hypothetical protein
MKTVIALIVSLFMGSAFAMAQDTDHPPRGLGYVFAGGGTRLGLTTGFGGEGYIYKGLGLGAELGAAGVLADSNKLTGVGSADASYHFFHRKIRGNASPFVAGGYTSFFGHNVDMGGTSFGHHKPLLTQGFNLGGGVDLFPKKHFGVRFDVRYYGHGGRILNYTFPDVQQFSFVAFRVGLTIR